MLRTSGMISGLTIGLLVSGCGQESPHAAPSAGQASDTPVPVQPSLAADVPQITGGYSETALDSSEVVAAAAFAIEEQSKPGTSLTLKSITTAQVQVVAGVNYQITLSVDEAGATRTAEAIVYQNLQGEKSLTSWSWK